jgi:uncharacterized repeat protein (TIGR03803 family)
MATPQSTVAYASEKIVHSFQGGNDGATPDGGLIPDPAGNLYGTTAGGGSGTGCYGDSGCGTLFKIARGGGESVLYSFIGGIDGISPVGALLMDNEGNFYGATEAGGGTGCGGYGCGTVFEFASDGTENVLYAFQGGIDGVNPQGSLIVDSGGNLYGVTAEGGSYNGSQCAEAGCGTVFEVQPNGVKNTLYVFQGGADGAFPDNGVLSDASGNLYGATTSGGGSGCNDNGCGTVFKLTPGGTEAPLYAFQGGADGQYPLSDLIIDGAGNFFGTTLMGGTSGAGTVFKISPTGQETVLYSFKGGSDGANPQAGVIMDRAGNLYGTTYFGGRNKICEKVSNGCGTVFKLAPNGKETVLYQFPYARGNPPDGAFPQASLLMGKKGKLYGTATAGDKYNDGVVFEVKK